MIEKKTKQNKTKYLFKLKRSIIVRISSAIIVINCNKIAQNQDNSIHTAVFTLSIKKGKRTNTNQMEHKKTYIRMRIIFITIQMEKV